MSTIIFQRLTIKEQQQVTAGDSASSNNAIAVTNHRNCDGTGDTSVGSGCIRQLIPNTNSGCDPY